MSDKYMTLLGAEQVQSAAGQMQSAASEMRRAADHIDGALRRHQQFLEDWLQQFRDALESSAEKR